MKYVHTFTVLESSLTKNDFEALCRLEPRCRNPIGFKYNSLTEDVSGDGIICQALDLVQRAGLSNARIDDATHFAHCVTRQYEKCDLEAAEFLLLDYQKKVQKGVSPVRDEQGRLIILARNVTPGLKFASTYLDNFIFVSDGVKRVLETESLTGLHFGETAIKGESGFATGDPAWEVLSRITLPPIANTHQLVHRGMTRAEPFQDDYSREVLISDPPFVGGEPHYRRSDLAAVGSFDIANMKEKFIHERALIISQRFYQHCLKNKIPLASNKFLLGARPIRIDPD